MTNLLRETQAALKSHKKTPTDVRFVMAYDKGVSWTEFATVADIEYDGGYGGNEIATSLKVVGDDWWLERGEYDGSEWWEFKTLPVRPTSTPTLNIHSGGRA